MKKRNLQHRLPWKATVVATWLVAEADAEAGAEADAEMGAETHAEAGTETGPETGPEADAEAWRANPRSETSNVLLVPLGHEKGTYGVFFQRQPP